MTENKRFIIDEDLCSNQNAFFEYDEHLDDHDFVFWVDDSDEILKRLNELGNENEELKKENNKWIVDYNGLNIEYQWLKEENEQLKRFVKQKCPLCGANLELFYKEQGNCNEFVYVLSRFLLYELEEIIMVSLNHAEIMNYYTQERIKLGDDWGLSVKKYELGKEYEHPLLVATVCEVVRKNGKLEELGVDLK